MLQRSLVYLGQGQDSLLYASLDEAGQLVPGTSITLSLHESLVDRVPETLLVTVIDAGVAKPLPAAPQSLMERLLAPVYAAVA